MGKMKILIAGAGPVGLSAAMFMSSNPNVEFSIVDKRQKPNSLFESRALLVNPRTLSLFNGYSIQQKIIKESIKLSNFKISTASKVLVDNQITRLLHNKTKFPYLYIYPQTCTQQLLQEELNQKNIFVKKGVEIVSVKNIGNNVIVKFKDDPNDHLYDYVLGTDGAHSVVRKQMGFQFNGQTLDKHIYVLDYDNHGQPITKGQVILQGKLFLLILPVKDNRVRIVCTQEDFQKHIPSSLKLKLSECLWKSSFRMNNRHTNKMSSGRVFLAGDAAHVHVPIGGRGMNLGIEDAFVFSYLLKEGKLDHYSSFRMPVVNEFIERVTKVSRFIADDKSLMKKAVPFLLPLLNRLIKNQGAEFMAGIDHDIPNLPKL